MTVKQISVSVGKDERTVQRWVKKAADKMSSVADKMTTAGHGKGADYDIDETCAIIEAGMGRNAAGIFRANAESSNINASYISTIVKETITSMVPAMIAAIRGALPERTVPELPAPMELTYRDQLRRVINHYAYRSGESHRKIWRDLYAEYYYRYHRNIRECSKNRDMDTLEYAEIEGIMPELLALATVMYGFAA